MVYHSPQCTQNIGKILRREGSHIPSRLLTAWCKNPRKVERPILSNKKCISQNLRLIIPRINDAGLLSEWGFHALDTSLWNALLETLKHPFCEAPHFPPNTSEDNNIPRHDVTPHFTPSSPSPPTPLPQPPPGAMDSPHILHGTPNPSSPSPLTPPVQSPPGRRAPSPQPAC